MVKNPKYRIRYNGVDDIYMESLSPRDMLARRNWANGKFYELPLMQNIRRYARPGTFFDGGANFGNHSVFFARFCEQCEKVIAVEAVSEVYQVMVRNVRANVDPEFAFEPCNFAIHSVSGMVAEFDPPDEQNYGATRMRIRERNHNDTQRHVRNRSLTQRIDDLVGVSNVTVLKLDLEGGEAEAIAGAFETISRCRPLIAAEASTAAKFDELSEQMSLLSYRKLSRSGKRHTYIWLPKELSF